MIFKILEAFSNKLYKIQGFEKDENGDTIIIYGYKNKRLATQYRKLASHIIRDKGLRKHFDYDDYTEIVSLAQHDSFIKNDILDNSIMNTYNISQKPQYVFLPYLIALTAVVWCFAAIIGHRFLMLNIENNLDE